MQQSAGRTLILAATRREIAAVLAGLGGDAPIDASCEGRWVRHDVGPRVSICCTGVGKVNAGAATAMVARPSDALVLSVGVCGSLPNSGLSIGDVVAGERSCYADEGLIGEKGFESIEQMGFPLGPFARGGIAGDPDFLARCEAAGYRTGIIATVSTCSGTDDSASGVRARTGADAEAMEGAAVGHVCARLGLRFGELRSVSNNTGDRARQVWDLDKALGSLSRAISLLLAGSGTVR